jgi:hypothetical protein
MPGIRRGDGDEDARTYTSFDFSFVDRAMISGGIWKLVSADGFLLFPGSDHVESVAVFDRADR